MGGQSSNFRQWRTQGSELRGYTLTYFEWKKSCQGVLHTFTYFLGSFSIILCQYHYQSHPEYGVPVPPMATSMIVIIIILHLDIVIVLNLLKDWSNSFFSVSISFISTLWKTTLLLPLSDCQPTSSSLFLRLSNSTNLESNKYGQYTVA